VPESTPSPRTANHVQGPITETRTTTSGQPGQHSTETVPASGFRQRRWVYAGLVAGVLFLLALWLRTQPDFDDSAPVYARTPATRQVPAVVSSAAPLETVPAAPSQVTSATAAPEAAPLTSASSVPEPPISQPAPDQTPAVEAMVTNVPPTSLPPKGSALPDFRLNGIIYTVTRPSAILNGKTVHVGDQVSGATVIGISRTEVTLRINGQRRTYELP